MHSFSDSHYFPFELKLAGPGLGCSLRETFQGWGSAIWLPVHRRALKGCCFLLIAQLSSLPPLSHLVKLYDVGFNRRCLGGRHKGKVIPKEDKVTVKQTCSE